MVFVFGWVAIAVLSFIQASGEPDPGIKSIMFALIMLQSSVFTAALFIVDAIRRYRNN